METTTKWILGVIAFIVVFIALCGIIAESEPSEPSEPSTDKKIGSAIVYERMDSSNCNELQKEFDLAMDNVEARQPGDYRRKVSTAYATYADARMRTIGCY